MLYFRNKEKLENCNKIYYHNIIVIVLLDGWENYIKVVFLINVFLVWEKSDYLVSSIQHDKRIKVEVF